MSSAERPPSPQPARRRSRDLRILVLVRTVNRLGAFALPFLTLMLTREQGLSSTEAGGVMAGFGVATMASRLLGGWLADVTGRRFTIVVGLVGCALADGALAATTSCGAVIAATLGLGLAFEIYESPTQAMVAEAVEPADRPAAFGLLGAALSLAALGSGILAAVLAPYGIRLLFLADAATCLTAAVLVIAALPPVAKVPRPPTGRAGSSPWRSPRLRFLFTANVAFAVCYLQFVLMLPLTLESRDIGSTGYGGLLAVAAFVSLAAQPLLRRRPQRDAGDRPPPWRTPALGYFLVGAGMAGYGAAETLPAFVAATIVVAVGDVVISGHVQALVAGLAPADRRGRYLAAFGLSWGVAAVIAPLIASMLVAQASLRGLWLSAGVCCAAVGIAHVVAMRRDPAPRRPISDPDVDLPATPQPMAAGASDPG